MVDDVEEDWSKFKPTDNVKAVRSAVEVNIRKRLREAFRDVHKLRKRTALKDNKENLTKLPTYSQYQIGQFVDKLQDRLPTIEQKVLSATVGILSNLEKARSGYALLEQLASFSPDDIDTLNEILEKWSVHEAQVVLDELERRLKLIERLEGFVDDPSSDELHDIHPLFARGLWIFGPEYESIHFSSNRSLSTVVRDLLKDQLTEPFTNPRKRPDFVVLPDSTVGVYASEAFDERAEVNGFDKVLVVELKRGGAEIKIEEHRQGEDYARELQKSGKVQKTTKIVVFVLGTRVNSGLLDADMGKGQIKVYPRSYAVVLRQAHARTFNLLEKIRAAKQEQLSDPDVEEVLREPSQAIMFSN